MSNKIFILDGDGELSELRETLYDSEDLLQKLLSDFPELLAGAQINSSDPRRWILISREIGIPDNENVGNRWSLDHLFIDQDGIPTLVEVKRSTDTRIRREVIGQILDYASNSVAYWSVQEIISLFETSCEENNLIPEAELKRLLQDEEEISDFWEMVSTNLKAGKIRMLVVADKIPKELRRIIEFLNGQMSPAEILGIEIKQFSNRTLKTLVPTVFGHTSLSENLKNNRPRVSTTITEDEYWNVFKKHSGVEKARIAKLIVEWVRGKSDYFAFGGSGIEQGIGHSLIPCKRHSFPEKDREIYPFSIWTSGSVELYFQHYKGRPPMDQEGRKIELLRRINEIEGVNIPDDKINKRPSFDLSLLKREADLEKFISAFSWFYDQFK